MGDTYFTVDVIIGGGPGWATSRHNPANRPGGAITVGGGSNSGNSGWDESKHKRAANGEFGAGSGKSSTSQSATSSKRASSSTKKQSTSLKGVTHVVPAGTVKFDHSVPPELKTTYVDATADIPKSYLDKAPGVSFEARPPNDIHVNRAAGLITHDGKGKFNIQLFAENAKTKRLIKGTVVHEVAHYHDAVNGRPSSSAEFKTLVSKMKTSMTDAQKQQFAYPLSNESEVWAYASEAMLAPHPMEHMASHTNKGFGRAAIDSGVVDYIRKFYKSKGIL